MSEDFKEVKELAMHTAEGKMFQAQETAGLVCVKNNKDANVARVGQT